MGLHILPFWQLPDSTKLFSRSIEIYPSHALSKCSEQRELHSSSQQNQRFSFGYLIVSGHSFADTCYFTLKLKDFSLAPPYNSYSLHLWTYMSVSLGILTHSSEVSRQEAHQPSFNPLGQWVITSFIVNVTSSRWIRPFLSLACVGDVSQLN